MIPVIPQPEPASFDEKVRQPGRKYLEKNKIDPHKPLPSGIELEPHWRKCSDELYESYHRCCAYLGMFYDKVMAPVHVDHFIPKLKRVDLAYEWTNYRLACPRMNTNKGTKEDILDPFEIGNGWFNLVFLTGVIYPSHELDDKVKQAVQKTIDQLKLNAPDICDKRRKHVQFYITQEWSDDMLKEFSPFIWSELCRQKMLENDV